VKYVSHYTKEDEKALYIVMEFCGQGSLAGKYNNNNGCRFDVVDNNC
jgi:serine/threonine protein kinase